MAAPRSPDSARPATNKRLALLVVTGVFASMLLTGNLATPLYKGYSDRFGFSPAVLGLVFATYALALIPSLLLFGQLSDQIGRRRVIAAGLGAAITGLALFAAAGSVWWLFAARATQGLAQGMLSGAATAALSELAGGQDPRRTALRATLAQAGGSAAGPLLAGMLAQWAPDPRVLPFLAGIVICVLAMTALRSVPETAAGKAGGWHVRRPRVPREIRGDFARVGLTAAAVWAVGAGLFLSIIPAYAGNLLHTRNLALLGAVTAVMLASSCVAQLLARNGAPAAGAQAAGLILLAAGLLALVLATPLHLAALLIAGAVLAGLGHGLAFLAAQDNLTQITPGRQRAEISAAFYVCIYLGVAVPVIGIGVLATVFSLFTGVAAFAAVTGAAALALAGWHLRDRGKAPPPHAWRGLRPLCRAAGPSPGSDTRTQAANAAASRWDPAGRRWCRRTAWPPARRRRRGRRR